MWCRLKRFRKFQKFPNNPFFTCFLIDSFQLNIINLNEKNTIKIFNGVFSPKQKQAHGIWLDKFSFLEIGALLRSSPKTIPIKMICFMIKE